MTEREKLITAIERARERSEEFGIGFIVVKFKETDLILKLLREQPEQKHGHWKGFTQSRYFGMDDDGEPIFRDGFFYVCSECRRKTVIKTQFCPRCGAMMNEVKQDES